MAYEVCTVQEYTRNGEKRNRWTKIGVAFQNKKEDNKVSFTIILDALPIGNRLVLKEALPPRDNQGSKADEDNVPF